ncbi:hypothetical protein LEP1GSC161_0083 [Leptospira santarosai str. CBC1416]|uniref:Uncharacterized protein n=1 Tax=Leptospira santarosai str. CBC1416 TaxID=1193059 RepID=M6VHF8_9LEPT|nr:hypothetical protein LEP1GSC161_0083 [Leptospira santarosai str. CBC1416]
MKLTLKTLETILWFFVTPNRHRNCQKKFLSYLQKRELSA